MENSLAKGRWFKLAEAAQLLGVSEITVRRRAKAGQLKSILRNGRYLVQLEENTELGLYVGTSELTSTPALPMNPDRKAQYLTLNRKETVDTRFAHTSNQDELVQSLKRTIADQQTLIASLEDSISRLSRKLSAEKNSST